MAMSPIIITLAVGLCMLACEYGFAAHRDARRRLWWPRAIGFNLCQAGVTYLGALTWDLWMPGVRLWQAHSLGLLPGALLGYLAITFVFYWWHRARHEVPFLWRWLHQLHHSPARIEVITSFYKHPLEILLNGLISSAVLYLLAGLDPTQASLAVLLTGLAELFYHWNMRTPYWLGFIIQRPESHRVHHRSGHHRNNYSDLPLWDMLFGTFENPRVTPARCGFDAAGELALGRMLTGRAPDSPAGTDARAGLLVRLGAALLVVVGCLQMAGDLLGLRAIKAVGAAWHASPAPKVFTAQEGFETYSSRFHVDWRDAAGDARSMIITPERYAGVRGPYNRRNAYGAAISYGPVLARSPATRPMLESVSRYALCRPAPLLRELGIGATRPSGPIVIRLQPRDAASAGAWQLVYPIDCGNAKDQRP
jgi:sterol desaturase/sphingolipid hydroxylase (fatty acid hydroxylase superfamily)